MLPTMDVVLRFSDYLDYNFLLLIKNRFYYDVEAEGWLEYAEEISFIISFLLIIKYRII